VRVWLLLCPLALSIPTVVGAETTALLSEIFAAAGFSEKQVRDLGAAGVVTEVEVADPSRQAAFAGLVRVEGDGDALVARMLGDGAPPLTTPQRFGYFGKPAAASDLAHLRLDEDDYKVLAECEPAACRFKLPQKGIAEARRIDWLSSDAPQTFLDLFRTALAKQTARYQREGLTGTIVYGDKPEPFAVARGIEQLTGEMSVLAKLEPGLLHYLNAYPADRPEGVTERLYWGVSDFGYRPTLSVDHVVVRESAETSGARMTMVLRTIYANHYLAGRLQFGSLIDGQAAFGVPGHYVLVMDRMLFDDQLSGVKRSLLGRGLKSNVSDRLANIRTVSAGGG